MTSKEALEELLGKAISNPYVGMVAAAALEKDLDKLDQYKTIEKELGIDLITLFKAQTQGFYIINVCDEIEKVKLSEWRFNLIKKEVHRVKRNKHLSFADYGKTWALDKKELEENGKD